MRPRKHIARERLVFLLGQQAAVSCQALSERLAISVPTLHRMLAEIGDQVVTGGCGRRTRYALRRSLRGMADLPVYRVDPEGQIRQITTLTPVSPQGTRMEMGSTDWPIPEESRDGWWPGLPYLLYDMRPRGYMGRQFARAAHRRLHVADNPDAWNDDDILYALSQEGGDTSGDLIVGEAACETWLEDRARSEPLPESGLGEAYCRLAEVAVAAGIPGSSAAGEFPKFIAMRAGAGNDTPHVIVKFSGKDDSATVQRWADLLVCEHLALECAAALPGIQSAKSRIIRQGGRIFLEVERFDRHGRFGRSPLLSLETLNAALAGAEKNDLDDWGKLAMHFQKARLLTPGDAHHIEILWWYGKLIGNTDMHAGNLSFRPALRGTSRGLSIAPVYDMLPMLYAPLSGGELPTREFTPPLPLPPQNEAWLIACRCALTFWRQAAGDTRIGENFRAECGRNFDGLRKAADTV